MNPMCCSRSFTLRSAAPLVWFSLLILNEFDLDATFVLHSIARRLLFVRILGNPSYSLSSSRVRFPLCRSASRSTQVIPRTQLWLSSWLFPSQLIGVCWKSSLSPRKTVEESNGKHQSTNCFSPARVIFCFSDSSFSLSKNCTIKTNSPCLLLKLPMICLPFW